MGTMRRNFVSHIVVFSAFALLTGCTPEGFDVAPCSLGGQLAFRIYPIDGWFRDYVPRPSSVMVGSGDGTHEWPGMWSAEAKFYGDEETFSKKLIVGQVLVYGQRLPGWEVSQPAKALQHGHKHWISMDDPKGHGGWAEFTAGEPLRTCF